jgi:hypothetical protein
VTSQKKKTRKRREKVLASREKVFEIRTNQHKNTKTQKKKRKKKRKENESSLLCSQSLFLNNWLGFRWALNCLAVTKNRRSIY